MDLPDRNQGGVFDDVEDGPFVPTDCAMVAAAADPRAKHLTRCDNAEKANCRRLIIDAMVEVMSKEGDPADKG